MAKSEGDVYKPYVEISLKDKKVPGGKFWNRKEKRQWAVALFTGTTMLYAARTIMPMAAVAISDELGWDKTEAGTVLSAFFWGYTMTQFLGGYLSDRIGGDVVLPVAACLWSLITFWTPQVTYLSTDKHMSLYIVVLSRVLLGICQGVHMPATTSMTCQYVHESVRTAYCSFVVAGTYLGTLLTGSVGSLLLDRYGWQMPFYFIGLCGLGWMLIIRYCVVGPHRQKYIVVDVGDSSALTEKTRENQSVPWVTLFTKAAFWAMIIGHFTVSLSYQILLFWMPTFFHDNFPDGKGWVFNVVPWVVTIPSAIFSGYLADRMISSGYSVTFVRKLMEVVCLGGTSMFLFIITYTSSYEAALFCMAAAVSCCGFHNSGILVNPQDIAPKHSGSVFGIMNMAGAIPGFIGVYMAGHILEVTKSWSAVFNQTAVVCIFGLIVYTLLGTGKKLI